MEQSCHGEPKMQPKKKQTKIIDEHHSKDKIIKTIERSQSLSYI